MKKFIVLTALFTASIPVGLAIAEKGNHHNSSQMLVKQVGGPVSPHTTEIDLRIMPKSKLWQPGDAIKEVPRRKFGAKNKTIKTNISIEKDQLMKIQSDYQTRSNRSFSGPIINIDGQGFNGVNPPDPTMDVGKNYVIQAINDGNGSKFIILDKSNGTNVAGPLTMSTLGSGQCSTGAGDPIVLYDEAAQRWFMQEFSDAGNFMCFYISKTDNPVTGGWHHYGYSDTEFPDYPHFGVWHNAFIGGANNSTRPIYAFDRENMLNGTTARPMQKFTVNALDGFGFQLATPADWDMMAGTLAPPQGSPSILMRHVDEEAHENSAGTNRPNMDYLEMFEFSVDWNTPGNSGVNSINIDFSDFNSCFVNLSDFGTVPQPNSSGLLDAIREVILNRLQYINFGTHESLVGVLPTNVTAGCTPVQAGLRWFELRRTGGTSGSWVLHQEGTYANETATSQNRLVGSISMDSSGNIALAYNMTDTNPASPLSASIKYTGRLASDPLGVMSQNEADFVIGSGANTSTRWGDYAAMAVDPIDACTFWFTGEYQDGSDWNTRISSVKFDSCGSAGFSLSSSDTSLEFCTANGSSTKVSTVNVNSIGGLTGNVNLTFNPSLPSGISGNFSNNPIAIGSVFDTSFNVAPSVNSGSYTATIQGNVVNIGNKTLKIDLNVVNSAPSATNLISPANTSNGINAAGLTYQWQNLSGASSYLIEVATTSDFSNIILSKTVGTNSYTATDTLTPETTYYWRVKASNLCGNGSVSNTYSFTTSENTPVGDMCFTFGNDIPDDLSGFDAIANVTNLDTITNLKVSVKASHTWVGDLTMTLSHNGTSVLLMDQPDEGGCEENNIDVTFSDGASVPVSNACQSNAPAISGDVIPESALSAFAGDTLNGSWTLNIVDQYPEEDFGTIDEFCLIPETSTSEVIDPIFVSGFE